MSSLPRPIMQLKARVETLETVMDFVLKVKGLDKDTKQEIVEFIHSQHVAPTRQKLFCLVCDNIEKEKSKESRKADRK